MRFSCINLLMTLAVVGFCGCAREVLPFVNRNGTYVRQDGSDNGDWVAQAVESSPSFRRIIARRPFVLRRYQVGSRPAWAPGWFIDSRDEDSVDVEIGADLDENFWGRSETLRVYRNGRVEREETRSDGESIWGEDK
jgi:hypothetical protein